MIPLPPRPPPLCSQVPRDGEGRGTPYGQFACHPVLPWCPALTEHRGWWKAGVGRGGTVVLLWQCLCPGDGRTRGVPT